MTADFAEAIRQLQQERGITEELVLKTIEDFLMAAYKRKYGTSDNALVRFNDDNSDVSIFAKKMIVEEDDYYDPVCEILIEEAVKFNEESELGDEILIKIDPVEFDRLAVQSAKQRARQDLREIQKDTLYSEFKDKVGEMIIGYYQREKNGNIFVDLGRTEGILPKRFQSPREEYTVGDRIKALICEVNKTSSGLQIVLSRTHSDFVKRIFELEVPEIYDSTIEIHKIVREAGYRTKIAVISNRDDVDPVGACVGLKGVRIQAIVRELEGEKIDILKYDPDPQGFIKNALSPAEVADVVVVDGGKRQALAIVPEQQLSLAIGKQGLNVRLANRLVDWSIDVKTIEQFEEMDMSQEISRAASELFSNLEESDEEITRIEELPDLPERVVALLRENGIDLIETLVNMNLEELKSFEGINEGDIDLIRGIIHDNVEIVEGDNEEDVEEDVVIEDDETYECPECGATITLDMSVCPSCGVGLSFEIEEIEQDDQE
ncbi:MAG: transcription termination/antitermination protein NusA [Spirochaetaceae bacterium 4572_59]|nr:MAG: transcription termination/antitermination protein NusA [Spirochaetaceae bacterium 4572_59]